MQELVVPAPAKINLTLDVLGKRQDGYHELETVMHQINLADRICLKKAPAGIRITSNSQSIPLDKHNLAYQAAEYILNHFQIKEGISIHIEKVIPIGAGLAGGSTDAAAVLRGIKRLYALPESDDEIIKMAAAIGSDVPFCVQGGTAIARGRGEILKPLNSGWKLSLVLVKPNFEISTAAVYSALDLSRVKLRPDNRAFLDAWKNCDIIGVASNMVNVLESVSIKKHPEINLIKHHLIQLGALNALMSGSGPSVFAVFAQPEQARRAYEVIRQDYRETYLVSSYI
ncbi:MAG: 4-(cytidine 5'-diphospho)-2-C-methyl-D-erythritol kinase [Syntrophomonadaceae bacterium]|jgi:4-diphosphocytidyl-2-C-methyl-D-erythritol kinase